MGQKELWRIVGRTLWRTCWALVALGMVCLLCVVYGRYVEPTWLRVRHVSLSSSPTVRLVHVSDFHFKGDTQYLERVVATINRLDADLVCFTGDLIEDAAFLDDALRILGGVNKPVYGIPGNHDQWALRSFDRLRAAFRATGGEWMDDRAVLIPAARVAVMTLGCAGDEVPAGYKRILLEHYPELAAKPRGSRFALILAGHTHGGQVKLPFIRRWGIPMAVNSHDRGLYQTASGPLYVSPGIGTFFLSLRFLCRPEVTRIEL